MKRIFSATLFALSLGAIGSTVGSVGFARLAKAAEPEKDPRARLKNLNDTDYHLQVPESKEAWTQRRSAVRAQILAASGLWPMPAKCPIKPTVTATIDRDTYTIQNVWFESRPGQIVTGSLFVPKDLSKQASAKDGKVPGVLCPHGHWPNGRFYETPEKNIPAELKSGAEERPEGAKYPVQARCHQLAKMGCIVFHYDMVGYADNRPVSHRDGFGDPQAELWSMNWFGLQTHNSVRALDYLLSLPGVDAGRIGVTGASGGGTQTFILGAIDERPTADFPAVMVGTRMQGGCVCENASWLRVGTGNVEFAGMFAPRPMGLSGANDWTVAIEKEGYPELKKLYGIYDKTDLVKAKCWPEFGHNYNQVAREFMYNWFNKHLSLGQQEPVKEAPFVPVPPSQLEIFPKGAKLPEGIFSTAELRGKLIQEAKESISSIRAELAKGNAKPLQEFLDPLMEMAVGKAPKAVEDKIADGVITLKRTGTGETVRLRALDNSAINAEGPITLVVVNGEEYEAFLKEKTPKAAETSKGKRSFVIEPFGISPETKKRAQLDKNFVGYNWGYNRPLVAERARDIQTALIWAKQKSGEVSVTAIGSGAVPVALTLAATPGVCTKAELDFEGFRFEDLKNLADERFLPGALRWGGIPLFLARGLPKGSSALGVSP